MRVVDIFAYFGLNLTAYIILCVYLFVFFNLNIYWQCGQCGKMNTTGVMKFLLQMCDHMGVR